MVESADIFIKLLGLSKKEANSEISKMTGFESRFNYFFFQLEYNLDRNLK